MSEPQQEYTVKPGDTLTSIAEKHWGDGTHWPKIYEANKTLIGADPDVLVPGQKLTIPPGPEHDEHADTA